MHKRLNFSISPVKIVTGLIFNDREILKKASQMLFRKFGPLDLESQLYNFNHTDYYNEEMGRGLKRKFLVFKKLKGLQDIYKIKLFTNRLEDIFSAFEKRRINIDPGYLTLSKLILLSTKDYSHRIYIKDGIYAEVTLFFKNGSYQPWEWTYPDYKTENYRNFFNRAREIYLDDLRRCGLQTASYKT